VARARELGVDMLVSACVWSERPLATAGSDAGIEVADIIELVAESAGIEVGGRRGASEPVDAGATP
jgi:heterodisulfide reductase subunit D